MSFDLSALDGDAVIITIDDLPFGNEPRAQNIAALRITPLPETAGGGFLVTGFEAKSALGQYVWRRGRIGRHGRNQDLWTLIANAAYALNHAQSGPLDDAEPGREQPNRMGGWNIK
jgi:hypothetical protein